MAVFEAHEDFGSLIAHVQVIADQFPTGLQAPLWYRGVRCDRLDLIPSLYRFTPGTSSEPKEAVRLALAREGRLLTVFRQRSLPLWPAGYSQDDWEQLFVMQHHGLPTRLLDWSENFFVAAYFALVGNPSPCPIALPHDCQPTVWVLNPVVLNRQALSSDAYEGSILTSVDAIVTERYGPGRPDDKVAKWALALSGTHNSARVVAQRGVFTVFGQSSKSLVDQTSDLSNYAVHHQGEEVKDLPSLSALHVASPAVASLRTQLGVLGFTESMVYPDMQGLAKELNERLDLYGG